MKIRTFAAIPAALILASCSGDSGQLDPASFSGADRVYVSKLNDYWRSVPADEALETGRSICEGFGTPGFNPYRSLIEIAGEEDAHNLTAAAVDAYCPRNAIYLR